MTKMSGIRVFSLTLFVVTTWVQTLAQSGYSPFNAAENSALFVVPSDRIMRRDDYWYTEGVGAHKFYKQPTTWNKARRICEQEGAYLVIVNSDAESKAIQNVISRATNEAELEYFVGAHDLFEEGEFLTIHSETLAKAGYVVWRAGEPNNVGGLERCVTMYKNGEMNDRKCESELRFVCELDFSSHY